jgi:hypothetical protein
MIINDLKYYPEIKLISLYCLDISNKSEWYPFLMKASGLHKTFNCQPRGMRRPFASFPETGSGRLILRMPCHLYG